MERYIKVFEYGTDNLVLTYILKEDEQVHISTDYIEGTVRMECNFTLDADKVEKDKFYTLKLYAPIEGGMIRKTRIHKARYEGAKTFEMFKDVTKENCSTLGLYGEVEIIP